MFNVVSVGDLLSFLGKCYRRPHLIQDTKSAAVEWNEWMKKVMKKFTAEEGTQDHLHLPILHLPIKSRHTYTQAPV